MDLLFGMLVGAVAGCVPSLPLALFLVATGSTYTIMFLVGAWVMADVMEIGTLLHNVSSAANPTLSGAVRELTMRGQGFSGVGLYASHTLSVKLVIWIGALAWSLVGSRVFVELGDWQKEGTIVMGVALCVVMFHRYGFKALLGVAAATCAGYLVLKGGSRGDETMWLACSLFGVSGLLGEIFGGTQPRVEQWLDVDEKTDWPPAIFAGVVGAMLWATSATLVWELMCGGKSTPTAKLASAGITQGISRGLTMLWLIEGASFRHEMGDLAQESGYRFTSTQEVSGLLIILIVLTLGAFYYLNDIIKLAGKIPHKPLAILSLLITIGVGVQRGEGWVILIGVAVMLINKKTPQISLMTLSTIPILAALGV